MVKLNILWSNIVWCIVLQRDIVQRDMCVCMEEGVHARLCVFIKSVEACVRGIV